MDNVSWIGYIVLGRKAVNIKDMFKPEIARKVAQLQRGDILSIRGLGTIQIRNIFNDVEKDDHVTYEEIGLYCERVDL